MAAGSPALRGSNQIDQAQHVPGQESTSRKVAGILLIAGGSIALAAAGVATAAYFSSSFAQTMRLTSLNGTLVGRIAMVGSFAAGGIALGFGIYFFKTSSSASKKEEGAGDRKKQSIQQPQPPRQPIAGAGTSGFLPPPPVSAAPKLNQPPSLPTPTPTAPTTDKLTDEEIAEYMAAFRQIEERQRLDAERLAEATRNEAIERQRQQAAANIPLPPPLLPPPASAPLSSAAPLLPLATVPAHAVVPVLPPANTYAEIERAYNHAREDDLLALLDLENTLGTQSQPGQPSRTAAQGRQDLRGSVIVSTNPPQPPAPALTPASSAPSVLPLAVASAPVASLSSSLVAARPPTPAPFTPSLLPPPLTYTAAGIPAPSANLLQSTLGSAPVPPPQLAVTVAPAAIPAVNRRNQALALQGISREAIDVLNILWTNDFATVGTLTPSQIKNALVELKAKILTEMDGLPEAMQFISDLDPSDSHLNTSMNDILKGLDDLTDFLQLYRTLTVKSNVSIVSAIFGDEASLPEVKLKACVDALYAARQTFIDRHARLINNDEFKGQIELYTDFVMPQLVPLLIRDTTIQLPVTKGDPAVLRMKSAKYAVALYTLKDALSNDLQNDQSFAPHPGKMPISGLKAKIQQEIDTTPSPWWDVLPSLSSRVPSGWATAGTYAMNALAGAAQRVASMVPAGATMPEAVTNYWNHWVHATPEQIGMRKYKAFLQNTLKVLNVLDGDNWDPTRTNSPNAPEFKDSSYLNKVRAQYSDEFMPALSAALEIAEECDYNSPPFSHVRSLKAMLERLAKTLHTGVILDDQAQATIAHLNLEGERAIQSKPPREDRGSKHPERMHPAVKEMAQTYDAIEAAPSSTKAPIWDKLARSFLGNNHCLYPNREGNPLHKLGTITVDRNGNQKQIQMLAYGTPTNERGIGTATITPEFKAFLRAWKAEGKTHLHTSYQSYIPVLELGVNAAHADETDRNNAIVRLQDQPGYENFYAIVLTKDSKFYHQKGEFNKDQNALEFRQELLGQFFGPDHDRLKTGCYISEKVQNKIRERVPGGIEKMCEGMILAIQQHIFPAPQGLRDDQRILNVEEKKVFIELFYTLLVRKLAIELDVDSETGVCKDGIDRGAMSVGRQVAFFGALDNKETSAEFRNSLKGILMWRAWAVRKRSVIESRFDRFLMDYEKVMQKSDSWKALCQRTFEQTTIRVNV